DRARALRARPAPPAPGGLAGAGPDGGSTGAGSTDTGLTDGGTGTVSWVRPAWPAELPDGGRHGWTPRHRRLLDEVVAGLAASVAARLVEPGGRTLVLGTEELMYTPMRLAAALGRATGGETRYQSTTRSPVHPLDVPGYAIRCALEFPAPDDPSRASQVYNVPARRARTGDPSPASRASVGDASVDPYDDIVVVVDDGVDAAAPAVGEGPALAGLVEALRRCAPVTVVTLPSFVPEGAR
ncbi:TRSP domain-containing protein, partial [Frankia sp. CNm7]|uniref:TRSP domain-containing protein n=1 Tax=Frankia nepalensis TaxID=1836974 RepID=UPI001931CC1D